MNIDEILSQARESITVKRVFGQPIEKDGLTLVPAAVVGGGGGGGTGTDEKGQQGKGGGFGLAGRPAGAVVMAGLVAITYLVTRPRVARARASLS